MTDTIKNRTYELSYIMELCLLYGKILQESNATNEMINDKVQQISRYLGLLDNELSTYNAQTSFIIINRHDNSVKMIPVNNAAYNFEKLVRVDEILSQLLDSKISPEEFLNDLHEIDSKNYSFSNWIQVISASILCGSMNIIINGTASAVLLTFLLGLIGYSFYLTIEKIVQIKIFSVLSYSTFICLLIVILSRNNILNEPYSVLFSCIMPLLPGTTFVNSIKAIMDGNYISGLIQSLDAINVAIMLGIPAAIIFSGLL